MKYNQDAVIIEPRTKHDASIIWLHGLGADGHDFEPMVPELLLPDGHGIRFIFPHAPKRSVTINGGMVMRAWYDVRHPDLTQLEDEKAIRESGQILSGYITKEIDAGIPSKKILIAGFSQGGAIVLFTGLRFPEQLAGILALSTYLPIPATLASEKSVANSSLPIMMMHGTYDPVIPVAHGKQSLHLLQKSGFQAEWQEYPMLHAVCPQEIHDISQWLQQCLLAE